MVSRRRYYTEKYLGKKWLFKNKVWIVTDIDYKLLKSKKNIDMLMFLKIKRQKTGEEKWVSEYMLLKYRKETNGNKD